MLTDYKKYKNDEHNDAKHLFKNYKTIIYIYMQLQVTWYSSLLDDQSPLDFDRGSFEDLRSKSLRNF